MAETTEVCSPNDDIVAIFSNLDADLPSLGPFSSAVSFDPEVIFLSLPNSPTPYTSSPGSIDEQESPDSTSTIGASANNPTVEVPPTVGVQLLSDNSNEDQHEPPPAYSFPTDDSPVLSRPNQFKHRAETANSVNSRHRREHFTSKPTAIIRPRIKSRLRYRLKPEFDAWGIIFGDNQRQQLTIHYSENILAIPATCSSPTGCHCSPSLKTLAMLLFKTRSSPFSFPPEAPIQFSSFFQRGELSRYRERSILRKDAVF